MKSGLCCLLLLFAAAQARDLTAYGGGGGGSHSSHDKTSHHAPEKLECINQVGYKIVAKDPKCGNGYCEKGHYCKTLKEVDCQYYPYDSCPKYGFRYYTCEPITIDCGKVKCAFGYKCGKKKVCSTDSKEYNDGHKTTVETKKCWYEDACVKEDPPLICSYDGKYKKCYVDPKYAAIAAGVACGHSKCPPGHKCVGACKVCKYEVVAYPYCESVSHYTPIPCGSGVCNPYQTCAVSERTVCKHPGSGGYSYYADGKHASNPGGYSYYVKTEGYKKEYYYYTKGEGHYTGSSGHHTATKSTGSGTGSGTGRGSAGGSRTSPTTSPPSSPSPPPPPPPPRPAAAAQSTSTSTPTATTANAQIASLNGGVAGSSAESANPNSVSGAAIAFANGVLQATDFAVSNNPGVSATGTTGGTVQFDG